MRRHTVLATILGFLASSLLISPIPIASAATLTPITFTCGTSFYNYVSGSAGDTIQVTLSSCSGLSISTTIAGSLSWTNGGQTNPALVTSNTFVITVNLLRDGTTNMQIGSGDIQFDVSVFGTFNCSVGGIENTSFTGNIGDTFSFNANGSCNLSVADPGIVSWRDKTNSPNPNSTVNSVVVITLIAEGTTTFTAQWSSYPTSGRQLNIAITSNEAPVPEDSSIANNAEPSIIGLTPAVNCKQGFSGTNGAWIQLTDIGCTPPEERSNVTLLGWSTAPDFSSDIARKVVENSWGAYQIFSDGRITAVFIPVNGYTQLTANNRIYPIWG